MECECQLHAPGSSPSLHPAPQTTIPHRTTSSSLLATHSFGPDLSTHDIRGVASSFRISTPSVPPTTPRTYAAPFHPAPSQSPPVADDSSTLTQPQQFGARNKDQTKKKRSI